MICNFLEKSNMWNYTLPSITIYYHLLPSIAIYYHLLPSITIYYHLLPSITIYYHLLPLSHVEPFPVEQSPPHISLSLLLSFQHLQQQSKRHPFDVTRIFRLSFHTKPWISLTYRLKTWICCIIMYNMFFFSFGKRGICYSCICGWRETCNLWHKFGSPFTQGPVHNFWLVHDAKIEDWAPGKTIGNPLRF